MIRSSLDYRAATGLSVGGFDPTVPTAGFYRMRLRRGAVPVGVHIFYGQASDPETGEPIDRFTWVATINDEPTDLYRVWPGCARDPIDEKEHAYLVRTQRWAEQHDPSSPYADRTKPVDLLQAAIPF